MSDDPKAKVQSLIALALHENTPAQEARNAAFLALDMIAKYNLLHDAKKSLLDVDPVFDLQWKLRHEQETSARYRAAAEDANKRAEQFERLYKEAVAQMAPTAKAKLVRRFTSSRYTGVCRGCGVRYLMGDDIAWIKDMGATHWKCRAWFGPVEDIAPVDEVPVQDSLFGRRSRGKRFI